MDIDQFLGVFFGKENRFDYSDIRGASDATHDSIRIWIQDLKERGAAVLPCWRPDGPVIWYGIATGEREMQCLSEQVQAFIGPSYSTFEGRRASLNSNDPIEAAIEDFTGGKALRFTGKDPAIRNRLHRLHQVLQRREPYDGKDEIGAGVVLRRFTMALRAGDRRAAEKQIRYLEERGLLTPTNIIHLQIRMLAAFEAWDEMLGLEDLGQLIGEANQPLPVRRSLVQGVYHVHFDSFDDQEDAEGAIQHFEETVYPEYGPLFALRSSMRAPEVLKAFALKAASKSSDDTDIRSDLADAAEKSGLDDPFLDAILNRVERDAPPQTIENPIEEAKKAFLENRLDRTFRHLQNAEPSIEKVNVLLLLSDNLSGHDVEGEISQTLLGLDSEEREAATERYPHCQQYLNYGSPPTSWTEWFEDVAEGRYETPHEVRTDAERLAETWSVDSLGEPGSIQKFVDALEQAVSTRNGRKLVSYGLPHILQSLQNDPRFPRRDWLKVYRDLALQIPYFEYLDSSDLNVYQDLAAIVLRGKISGQVYNDIIDGAEILWEGQESPEHIDWLLDFAELLALAPTRDENARLRIVTTTAEAVAKFYNHVCGPQAGLFRKLCRDIGHPEIGENAVAAHGDSDQEQESRDPLCEMLCGATLGIYTLTESAGRRARDFLQSHCSEVTIHLRSDKKGSADLHQAAESADYFLVVTRSATHAATGVIEQHVHSERLIRPRGKGESSMIRDIAEYAENRLES